MTSLFNSFRIAVVCGALAMMGLGAYAQLKVDYKALPDFDKKLPTLPELAIPNGNARFITKAPATPAAVAKSGAYGRSTGAEPLPDHWNNALTKYFPPIFQQAGPSCMGSSFTGYIFTHELNAYRDLDGSLPQNQMAVFFGWLQTFMNSSKEDIERDNGCPNAVDYGGRTNSEVIGYADWRTRDIGWMQGYDKWYRAMFNRAQAFYEFPLNVGTEAGREAVKRWIYNHNGDTDFKSGGLCYVTLAATSMTKTIQSTPTNDAIGLVGKKYINQWSDEINHAQTLVGWDDRVEFDLDENGVYGEKDKDEVGAWIICNSWNTGWADGGFAYVPYRRGGPIGKVGANWFWNPYITYIRKDHTPKRTIKLLMDYSHRSELYFKVGVNPDTSAVRPSFELPMTSFKNAGDGAEDRTGPAPEVPMLGRYTDGMHYEPMEFGYDLTDLSAACDLTKPVKYFFTVNRNSCIGSGHIYKASIMDYMFESKNGSEIKFDIDTVALESSGESVTTISVVVPGEPINPPSNARLQGATLSWDAPLMASLKVKKYYIYKNNVLCDSTVASNRKYSVSDQDGNYSVAAVYGYKTRQIVSDKSNTARLPIAMPEGDNQVLSGNGISLLIPNAVPSRLSEATIEFMLKVNDIAGGNCRIIGSKDENFFFDVTASGQARAGWSSENMIASSAKSIKPNTWYHIAILVQRNQISLYVNGMRKGVYTSSLYSGLPALGDVMVGSTDGLLNGQIDEFRIWRKARTQAEIYSGKDYAVSAPSAQADLVAYLPMNTITDAGQTKYQEFACGNDAYIVQGDGQNEVCSDILKGNTFKFNPTILVADSVYANMPFVLQGSGPVSTTKWQWSLSNADKATSDQQSPVVTYAAPGLYTVSLTTTSATGEQLTTEKEVKVVSGTLPEPDFEISVLRQSTNGNVSFINRTPSSNCTYVWEIEGQPRQYATNANVIFEQPGIFNVTLIATNSAGSASVTKSVEIYKAPSISQFNIAPSTIFKGETTYLEDKSTGAPESWIWTLSNGKRYLQVDGQFSSLVPPAPGYYDVTLQTANSAGANIARQNNALCVMNADPKTGLVFYGNNEQLEFDRPFAAGQAAFTIDWWMNPSVYPGAGAFTFGDFSTDCSDLGVYTIYYKDRKMISSSYIIRNEWHHYAITFSAGTINLWRDGVQILNFNASTAFTTANWPEKFTFSRSDRPFNGSIDELRIWNLALTKLQLQTYCNAPIEDPAKITRLCLYYDFNQSGGDVIDRTPNQHDAKRVNFGPDGDAWIPSVGVFTLDFGTDAVKTDVTAQYLTNYKAPFLHTDKQINPGRSTAYELITEAQNSTWVFKSPKQVSATVTQAVHADSYFDYQLLVSTYNGFGSMSNQRLYQTVSLPQGHYKFSITKGTRFDCENSRLVVCLGDSIVDNENLDASLVNCMLSNSQELEFDIADDNTSVSLGIIYNVTSNYSYMGVKSFNLYRISSTSQVADGVGSAYDAVDKGKLGTFSGERGAIRIVSNELVEVKIYNLQGQLLFHNHVSGNHRIAMPAGIYVVNGEKVEVR